MVVATGFFDGVHLGHRQVLDALVSEAARRGTGSAVVTFWPHPRNVLQNGARGLRLLSSPSEKEALIRACGVDKVEVVEFTREFSRLTAEEYLREYVISRFGAEAIVLGWDNRMGANSKSSDEVAALAQGLGLAVIRTAPRFYSGREISSTRIRAALSEGDIASATAMLGYAYGLSGVVVEGNKIGRSLGFPTANMQMYDPLKLIPAGGVYLTRVHTLGRDFYGMTNIGTRPTVTGVSEGEAHSDKIRTVETNIFDLSFLRRIRKECRFSSLEELKRQLSADKAFCLELLSKDSF